MGRAKLFFHNNRTWIYNLQYVGYSILLLILVALIDLRILPWHAFIPAFFTTEAGLARSILTTLAGALLTITTFTFSTILTVMSVYASNYTPRTVENFVNMKITMKVLGIFIGGFFYCISALLLTRDAPDGETVISGVTAVLYSIVCIIYFVIFVQKVVAKFQGVNLVSDIADEAADVIKKEYEARLGSAEYAAGEERVPAEILSAGNGYLSVIDTEALTELLEPYKGLCRVSVRLGDYLIENEPVASLSLDRAITDEKLQAKLSACFFLQDSKVAPKDYRYNLTKLTEISLRALSPGINDPNTATHIIRKMGATMAPLASLDSYHISVREQYGCQIFYTSYPFKEDLYDHFAQIVHYGKGDAAVTRAVLEALRILFSRATAKNRRHICEFASFVYESALSEHYQGLDQAWLDAAYAPFAKAIHEAEKAR